MMQQELRRKSQSVMCVTEGTSHSGACLKGICWQRLHCAATDENAKKAFKAKDLGRYHKELDAKNGELSLMPYSHNVFQVYLRFNMKTRQG